MASSSSSSAGPAAIADPPIVHVAFSSDASHFIACTATGFYVFSCDGPVERIIYRWKGTFASAGLAVNSAALFTRSRVAVVTRRRTGAAEHHEIRFWDEEIGISATKTPGLGAVVGLRLLGDHALVVGQDKATLVIGRDYGTAKPVATGANPLGLCALVIDGETLVGALPRPEKGAVQVCRNGMPACVNVRAHSSSLSCIALSRDGRLLATAGSKGTLLRVFSTHDGTMVQELRRGIDRADIHCIAYSPDSRWLAVCSDKGTVHVFAVASAAYGATTSAADDGDALPTPPPAAASPPAPATAKQGSSLPSFIKGYLPRYFSSEWSLAQFRLREGVEYTVEFWRQEPHIILIAGTDGRFYRCHFDPEKAGEMVQLEHTRSMKIVKESQDS